MWLAEQRNGKIGDCPGLSEPRVLHSRLCGSHGDVSRKDAVDTDGPGGQRLYLLYKITYG